MNRPGPAPEGRRTFHPGDHVRRTRTGVEWRVVREVPDSSYVEIVRRDSVNRSIRATVSARLLIPVVPS